MSEKITVTNGELYLTVDLFGAEIKSLKKGEKEYIWCGDENVWGSTAPILFPICGALKDDVMHYGGKEYNVPKHGFANHNEFTLSEKTENSITLSFSSNENTLKFYPFDFIFSVKFELNDNKLNVYYIVENTSNKNMYFSLGAHEGFALDGGVEGARVEFDKNDTLYTYFVTGPLLNGLKKKVTDNENSIVLSNKDFEVDAFIFKNIKSKKLSIYDKSGVKKITYIYDNFKNLLLWTKPGAEFLCVEPWNGMPDSIDSDCDFSNKEDIIELKGETSITFTHTIIAE